MTIYYQDEHVTPCPPGACNHVDCEVLNALDGSET